MSMISKNPYTNAKIAEYPEDNSKAVEAAIENAHKQHERWRKRSFKERAQCLNKAADLLDARKEKLATTMSNEMGKPLQEGISEIEKCAWVCRYYAEHAETFLTTTSVESDASKSMVAYRPLGVVLAVMPWNYPFWQVMRFAAPALMAGNAGLLKHASNVSGCALAIEKLFEDAGCPEGLFKTLLIPSDRVAMVIEHPLVRAATLTGSTPAGKAVAAKAGEELKKTVLELGGSDPYLILEDADLDLAAEQCAQSRLLNTGQSCIGAKRFIVLESVYDAFLEKFMTQLSQAIMGDPLKAETTLGPMARHDLRDELHEQVKKSIQAGASCVLGGEIPDHEGAMYPPTVLVDVKPGMPAYDEELFGPVASVIKVSSEAEAIRVANDSDFGLGSAIFSQNIARAEALAIHEIEAGSCFINHFVKSDPRLPFGGIKQSGYGRELGPYGIREFVNTKTVSIA
jgi:succinate-semialdehyde dehydrogenase / glutarate-semialdehyde dehydrogenase